MLQSLYIKDFILIEKLELDFSEGYTVITGETGAGKSILLDSILFCLGEKLSSSPVRPGADSCSVSCIFSSNEEINQFLVDNDIDTDDQLIIKRTQNINSRKKYYINDCIVTAKILRVLFDLLIEMHGQHNHTLLLDKASHIKMLDEYASLDRLKHEVFENYQNWQVLEKKRLEFQKNQKNIEEEREYLEHICSELTNFNVKIGEEQELAQIKRQMQNKDAEIKLLTNIIDEIDQSAFSQVIARSQKALAKINNNEILNNANEYLEIAYDKIEDAKSYIKEVINSYNEDDYSLEEIDDRLHEIRDLSRKHKIPADELPNFLNKSKSKLKALSALVNDNSQVEKNIAHAQQAYFKAADTLSQERKKAAKSIEKKTMEELSLLEMKKAVFKVEIESDNCQAMGNGIDIIRFMASTNPGMELSPIDKIASGGELSRFMLAFRVALFDKAPKNTIIFDEIDVGISGSVADSIGDRLRTLSKAVQIIVITHQPQVAGKANKHILVEKLQGKEHTHVKAKNLTDDEKSLELARMISGKTITKAGIDAAKELII